MMELDSSDLGMFFFNNQTGAVLGFIGGRNYAENQNNHAFDTERYLVRPSSQS